MHWILDGYNIIHSDHELSRILGNNLEAGRDNLIQKILTSRRFSGEIVFLVFDGSSGGAEMTVSTHFQVLFSKRPESADDLIKKMIGAYHNRRAVVAVSNDHSIIDYAKECGARVVKSNDFLSLIKLKTKTPRKENSFSEKPSVPSKLDLELLRLFEERKHES